MRKRLFILIAGLLGLIVPPLVLGTPTAVAAGSFVTFNGAAGTSADVNAYACGSGDRNYGYPIGPVVHAYNGCGVRVWIHQYVNWQIEGGWALCANPYWPTFNLPAGYQYPQNIYISTNANLCDGVGVVW